MTRVLCYFCLSCFCLMAAAPALSQVPVPVAVEGGGSPDFLTAVPGEFADLGATGIFTFGGAPFSYELTSGDVGGLVVTNPGPPLIADFSNSAPVTFSVSAGDISMNYAGEVTLTPVDNENFTAVFVANFVPIVGSGTGVFEDVVGGQFEMTATTSGPFIPKLDPSQIDGFTIEPPYTWSTTGGAGDFFLVIPEPTSLASILCLASITYVSRRRRA